MKTYLIYLIFLAALFPLHVFSQSEMEDVIYLKDGTIYRGIIIEQIQNVSFKIEIPGGSVIFVPDSTVSQVAFDKKSPQAPGHYLPMLWPKPIFIYPQKGYSFQTQLLTEVVEFGCRFVNGYKFGQFGYLGVGTGADFILCDLRGNSDYAGAYLPFYIQYSGDIWQKQITPFYCIEAGYAYHINPMNAYALDVPGYTGTGSNNTVTGTTGSGKGGFMAGAGFGLRFYTRRRVHFDLSAHLDFKMMQLDYVTSVFNQYGDDISDTYFTVHKYLIIPGLRMGVGF